MTGFKLSLLAATATATLAVSAAAHSQAYPLSFVCLTNSCVYDNRNQIVGTNTEDDWVRRSINGIVYRFYFDNLGFANNGAPFAFATPDCSGPKYLFVGPVDSGPIAPPLRADEPPTGAWDGSNLWIPTGSLLDLQFQAEGIDPAHCFPNGGGRMPHATAQVATEVLALPPFTPPFTVR